MPRSDVKINYYLRPQKSIERKMMCELFHKLNSQFCLNKYRYIGMGAKYFVDFILLHREFGFDKMVSIEGDVDYKAKYDFNKPLTCIKMEYNLSSDALRKINWEENLKNIVWLDFDQTFQKFMIEDIISLLTNLKSGSIFFVSFNVELGFKNQPKLRFEKFRKQLSEYCPLSLKGKDLADNTKCNTIKRIIDNNIKDTLNRRNLSLPEEEKLMYQQLVYFQYRDGVEMITLGGILLDPQDRVKYELCDLATQLSFLVKDMEAPMYSLEVPHLTYKEMSYLMNRLPCDDISKLDIEWFSEKEKERLKELYRYYPFFTEAASFN